MTDKKTQHHDLIRLGKYLNEVVVVKDASGKVLHQFIKPLMIEFYPRDVIQVIIGASILAVPVAFTEEVWHLGRNLPWVNLFALFIVSISFIATFVYYNYYREHFKTHWPEFIKRTLVTYFLSFIVVSLLLTIIQQADWINFFQLSLRRSVIVAFPASMSAAVADTVK